MSNHIQLYQNQTETTETANLLGPLRDQPSSAGYGGSVGPVQALQIRQKNSRTNTYAA